MKAKKDRVVITNNYLKKITHNPPEILYKNTLESAELEKIDEAIEQNAKAEFLSKLESNINKLKELYAQYSHEDEKGAILEIAALSYYHSILDVAAINEQLNLCKKLLESDVSKRNSHLESELETEIAKLKAAKDTNHKKLICTYLDQKYKQIYPEMNKTDRYVRISEIMNIFSNTNLGHFYTESEADKHVLKIPLETKSGREYIKHLIKQLIMKDVFIEI